MGLGYSMGCFCNFFCYNFKLGRFPRCDTLPFDFLAEFCWTLDASTDFEAILVFG